MLSGLTMHCDVAPRMRVGHHGSHVWIDVTSGPMAGDRPMSQVGIFANGRSVADLQRAVDAFNAAMDGATLLPVYASRDAEHAASPAGRLAAEIEGDATDVRRAGNRDLAAALDGAAVRELEQHL